MTIEVSRRFLLLGTAALPLLSMGGSNGAWANDIATLEQQVRQRQAALRVAEERHAAGLIPYRNVQDRQRELAEAEAALQAAKNGSSGGSNNSGSSSGNTSGNQASSSDIAALEQQVRQREAALRVAKERHAAGLIPYRNVQDRERELAEAQAALAAAKNGTPSGGNSDSDSGGDSGGGGNDGGSSGGQTTLVSNGSSLQNALSQASPGARIVLLNGTYSRSGGFLISRNGSSSSPITIEAQNTGGARFSSPIELRGHYIRLIGCRFDNTSVSISRDHCRVSRCRFQGSGGRLTIDAGADAEINRNEFTGWTGRAIDLNPRISDRRGLRPHIHHNYFYDAPSNADVAISIGQQASHHDINVNGRIEYNLIENCRMDQVIRFKCSGNTCRRNTLMNSGSISNRHGRNNKYIENWMENSKALLISDEKCEARGNRLIKCDGGIQVLAGNITPSQVQNNTGGHPRSQDCQIIDNDGRLQIGRTYSNWNQVYPALRTVVSGHLGNIVRGSEQGTSIQSTGNANAGKNASRLSRSSVGV